MSENKIYPCTIVADRYKGCYSDALWLAFNCDPSCVPDAIGNGDQEEINFWYGEEHKLHVIGKGETPQEAHENLSKLLETDQIGND